MGEIKRETKMKKKRRKKRKKIKKRSHSIRAGRL